DSSSVTFQWYVNDVNVYNQTISSVTNGTSVVSTLSPGNFSAGEYVSVTAQANDGQNLSQVYPSPTVYILSSVPSPVDAVIAYRSGTGVFGLNSPRSGSGTPAGPGPGGPRSNFHRQAPTCAGRWRNGLRYPLR